MRTPVFELHILPMMRAMDREAMRFRFDLWSYDEVRHHADSILLRLSAHDMPPSVVGGPWPDEWISLFRRWMTTGFKRLALGTAQYEKKAGSSRVRVYARGSFPTPGFKGWLQLDTSDAGHRAYTLYFEEPDQPVAGPPQPFEIEEKYAATDTRDVRVSDANGQHTVIATPVA